MHRTIFRTYIYIYSLLVKIYLNFIIYIYKFIKQIMKILVRLKSVWILNWHFVHSILTGSQSK